MRSCYAFVGLVWATKLDYAGLSPFRCARAWARPSSRDPSRSFAASSVLCNGGCGDKELQGHIRSSSPTGTSLWLAPDPTERSPEGGEIRRWVQPADNGGGGGRQARVQHHRAHLQRAPQRRPHRVPHLQAPPVSTISLPSDGDLSSVPPSSWYRCIEIVFVDQIVGFEFVRCDPVLCN